MVIGFVGIAVFGFVNIRFVAVAIYWFGWQFDLWGLLYILFVNIRFVAVIVDLFWW